MRNVTGGLEQPTRYMLRLYSPTTTLIQVFRQARTYVEFSGNALRDSNTWIYVGV